MFSCEFWDIFENIYFVEHLRTAASEYSLLVLLLLLLLLLFYIASVGFRFLRYDSTGECH